MEVSEIKKLIGKNVWVMIQNKAVECKIIEIIAHFSKDAPVYNYRISVHDTDIRAPLPAKKIAFSREELLKNL